MTIIPRVLLVLPLLCAALLFGVIAQDLVFASILFALPLVTLIVRPREINVQIQLLVLLVCVILGSLIVVTLPEEMDVTGGALGPLAFGIGVSSLLLASLHGYLPNRFWGAPVTMGLGLLSLLACGSAQSGVIYPIMVVLYLLLAGVALHANDPGRPGWRDLTLRHWVSTASLLILAGAVATGFALVVPPLYVEANRWIPAWARQSRSGFWSGSMRLGSLKGMILSDKIVMRVHGPAPRHLRGKVLREYDKGYWHARARSGREHREFARVLGEGVTELQMVSDRVNRFFLPLDVGRVHLEPSRGYVDDMGVLVPKEGSFVERIWYAPGSRTDLAVAKPEELDEKVPGNLNEVLDAVLSDWVDDFMSDSEKLAAIEAHLSQDFTYSLEADIEGEPMRSFLTDVRKGHCEYFASAMALLSRRQGIPARVVVGFVVLEHNPLGGYYIVRERDAHAWVEAWVDDGPVARWVTFDPSPSGSFTTLDRTRTPLLSGIIDMMGVGFDRVGLWPILGVLLVALSVLVVRRRLRERSLANGTMPNAVEPPPRYVVRFLDRLAQVGYERSGHEPLEALARRLDEAVQRDLGEAQAAALVRRYAALRYGGVGDPVLVKRELEQWRPSV